MANNSSPYNKIKITCICPRCKQNHVKKIFWTGDTVPHIYIYCKHCKNLDKSTGMDSGYSNTGTKRSSHILG
jgi:hypothetical protein